MKKIYLVYTKKRVYTPKNEIKFEGIVKLVTSCETAELAQEFRNSEYELYKVDFHNCWECFAKGEVTWDDNKFKMIQVEEDKTIVVTWEITQVNLQK